MSARLVKKQKKQTQLKRMMEVEYNFFRANRELGLHLCEFNSRSLQSLRQREVRLKTAPPML